MEPALTVDHLCVLVERELGATVMAEASIASVRLGIDGLFKVPRHQIVGFFQSVLISRGLCAPRFKAAFVVFAMPR
ncbi:MAG TPA: hypothetical protein VEI02_12140 [Planctomycetota bacterium]|nr:hypothetical protein [Planctomycetota bacterium]